MRGFILPAVLSALATIGAPARANVAAQQRPAKLAGAVAVAPGTALSVERELLEIVCGEERGGRCTFRARYFVLNATGRAARAVATFWGRAERVAVSAGGRGGRRLDRAELLALERGLSARITVRRGTSPHPVGVDLDVPPGGREELVATGEIRTGWAGARGYVLDAVHARHQLLEPGAPPSARVLASYYLAPIRSFARAGPIELVVRHPGSWTAHAWLETTGGGRAPVALRDADGGSTALLAPEHAEVLSLSFETRRTVHPGGPFAGLGGAFGDGLRLRAGYEAAAPGWLFYSLSAETDARELVQVTPGVEAATPNALFLPSLGLGVGAPIRLEPGSRAGLRLLGSAGWRNLGAVGTFDWFPATGARGSETCVSVLATAWL